VARYFAVDQALVDELAMKTEEASRTLDEYVEEHAVEDGLLWEALDDGKVTRALVALRLKSAKGQGADGEEIATLQHASALYAAEAAAKTSLKNAQAALDLRTVNKYGELTDRDVRTLVLDAKWQPAIVGRIEETVSELVLSLVARIEQLGERYDVVLSDLEDEVEKLDAKVMSHLAEMGIVEQV
jgi:type I restriction enzyme M protein